MLLLGVIKHLHFGAQVTFHYVDWTAVGRVDMITAGHDHGKIALASLMNKLKEYEQQQTTWKSSLSSQVAHETGKVVGGLTELQRMVDNSLNLFNERLTALEQDGKDGGKSH